ncbi:hypothetical protein BGW39_004309 [Mortierella sp. 14UC]|nr:hypothetical protein BGW39_004309 [Mortierella sp. 14UC]
MDTTRSKRVTAILSLGILFLFNPVLVAAGQNTQRPYQGLERLVALSSDHATYDSDDFSASELAGMAIGSGNSGFKGEINRCSQVPNTKTNRVLCLCNNGVDLTAEVDYALEGVVDIQAAGGDGVGTGEAGKIREVVYGATKTLTKVVTVKEMVTTTVTSFAPAPPPATVTETVTVVARAVGTEPTAKPVPTPLPVEANKQPYECQVDKSDDSENDKFGDSEADKPDEQDDKDESALPNHSESIIRKGAHHGLAKVKAQQDTKWKAEPAVKIAQVALDLANSEAQAQFGAVAQELDETGVLAFDPDAYQDPYLAQELAGMVSIDELQAYADGAEVEAEGDLEVKSRYADKDVEDIEDAEDADDEDMNQDEDDIDELNEEEEGQDAFSASSAEDQEGEEEEEESNGEDDEVSIEATSRGDDEQEDDGDDDT